MADTSDIAELQKRIIAFRDERYWKQFHNPKDLAISLLLEAGELLEHFQWKDKSEMTAHVKRQKEAVSDELADVMYWVLLIAHDLEIDLKQAVHRKMDKNELKYPKEKATGNHKKYTEL
jgi:dCTP diphosphatase